MMGQLLNSNNKARPSNPDLPSPPKTEPRRSSRRRNVRCTFDFDDYLDDDEYSFVEEEEDERRREKKIKLLLKLRSATTNKDSPSYRRKLLQSIASCSSASENENNKNSGKGNVSNGEIGGKGDSDDEEEVEYNDGVDDFDIDYDQIEVKEDQRQEATSKVDCAPGLPTEPPSECLLPDKNGLELLLRKLQKKDIYGVYAEPVDPEELPDYHDLIKKPMDFSTIRSKLFNGAYATLEQFESDVFLLCSNAMQYNEPDTIYHKQARSIQDLAKRKFQKLRIDNERLENQMKTEPKPKPLSVFKNQIQRQSSRTLQEPIESVFSADATPASVAHTQNGSNVMHSGVIDKASNLDALVEGNHFVIDTSVDKLEESLAGRDLLPRFARMAPMPDNIHTTYDVGSQPNAISDSAFSPFDGEYKQLIPMALHVEHVYARSLARFAGSLGYVAWRVASKRIEQILPPGTKFGRGWVGEYEPFPTPVLIPDDCNIYSDFVPKHQNTDNP